MTALTTRQRDLLHRLLEADVPLPAADLADEMNLTPRQVNYGLKGLKQWLAQRHVALKITPGVGVALDCSPVQALGLRQELAIETQFQLILSVEQRQQLLALVLLDSAEPFIVYQLQQLAQVSRTTILKDLDAIDAWLHDRSLIQERRPNFGIQVLGSELHRRQALAALLWGDNPFGEPLTHLNLTDGLTFALRSDAGLMPLVKRAAAILRQWDVRRAFSYVAFAEAQLGGRFTDDAVLHLALTFAIQNSRVERQRYVTLDNSDATLDWLRTLSVWLVADQVAERLGWRTAVGWPPCEVATLALHLLAAPRNERWPGDLDIDRGVGDLIDTLIQQIAAAYEMPALLHDKTLRDSLVILIVPALSRQRFGLWHPPAPGRVALDARYEREHAIASAVAESVGAHLNITLPEHELTNLTLLLRAAYIRERPTAMRQVIVVCPAGMATAQLLVARLKTRFPRLGTLKVLSMREITPRELDVTDLIITTTPLPPALYNAVQVIQVHPLLLPEDVKAITAWLA